MGGKRAITNAEVLPSKKLRGSAVEPQKALENVTVSCDLPALNFKNINKRTKPETTPPPEADAEEEVDSPVELVQGEAALGDEMWG